MIVVRPFYPSQAHSLTHSRRMSTRVIKYATDALRPTTNERLYCFTHYLCTISVPDTYIYSRAKPLHFSVALVFNSNLIGITYILWPWFIYVDCTTVLYTHTHTRICTQTVKKILRFVEQKISRIPSHINKLSKSNKNENEIFNKKRH